MTTIGSIGIGLFILIIVWILTLIVFVIAVRTQSSNFGWFAIAIATLLTVILVVIPADKSQKVTTDIPILEKDYSYIYRSILLSFLVFSVIVGFVSFFALHCIEPVRPKPIKTF